MHEETIQEDQGQNLKQPNTTWKPQIGHATLVTDLQSPLQKVLKVTDVIKVRYQ
jgi:hypothetical protein